jgi:hypothetical protein
MATKLPSSIKEVIKQIKLSPKMSKIVGVVKLPDDVDEKAELDIYFRKKHWF